MPRKYSHCDDVEQDDDDDDEEDLMSLGANKPGYVEGGGQMGEMLNTRLCDSKPLRVVGIG